MAAELAEAGRSGASRALEEARRAAAGRLEEAAGAVASVLDGVAEARRAERREALEEGRRQGLAWAAGRVSETAAAAEAARGETRRRSAFHRKALAVAALARTAGLRRDRAVRRAWGRLAAAAAWARGRRTGRLAEAAEGMRRRRDRRVARALLRRWSAAAGMAGCGMLSRAWAGVASGGATGRLVRLPAATDDATGGAWREPAWPDRRDGWAWAVPRRAGEEGSAGRADGARLLPAAVPAPAAASPLPSPLADDGRPFPTEPDAAGEERRPAVDPRARLRRLVPAPVSPVTPGYMRPTQSRQRAVSSSPGEDTDDDPPGRVRVSSGGFSKGGWHLRGGGGGGRGLRRPRPATPPPPPAPRPDGTPLRGGSPASAAPPWVGTVRSAVTRETPLPRGASPAGAGSPAVAAQASPRDGRSHGSAIVQLAPPLASDAAALPPPVLLGIVVTGLADTQPGSFRPGAAPRFPATGLRSCGGRTRTLPAPLSPLPTGPASAATTPAPRTPRQPASAVAPPHDASLRSALESLRAVHDATVQRLRPGATSDGGRPDDASPAQAQPSPSDAPPDAPQSPAAPTGRPAGVDTVVAAPGPRPSSGPHGRAPLPWRMASSPTAVVLTEAARLVGMARIYARLHALATRAKGAAFRRLAEGGADAARPAAAEQPAPDGAAPGPPPMPSLGHAVWSGALQPSSAPSPSGSEGGGAPGEAGDDAGAELEALRRVAEDAEEERAREARRARGAVEAARAAEAEAARWAEASRAAAAALDVARREAAQARAGAAAKGRAASEAVAAARAEGAAAAARADRLQCELEARIRESGELHRQLLLGGLDDE